MKVRNQIQAIFMLIIFSMFMLHQALPHVHHQHEGLEDSIEQTIQQDHTHEHEHHHDDDTDNDFDFLDFLLGFHTHSTHAENIPSVKSNVKHHITVNDISLFVLSASKEPSNTTIKPGKALFGQQPSGYFYNRYLLISSLRGPPSLG